MHPKGKVPLSPLDWFRPGEPIMPTGIFKGKRLSVLPTAYLRLALTQDTAPDLRAALVAELERRENE
jgi:hypothetical protein